MNEFQLLTLRLILGLLLIAILVYVASVSPLTCSSVIPSQGLFRGGLVQPTTGSMWGSASRYSSVSESLLEEYAGPRPPPISPFCARWPAALPNPVYFTILPTVIVYLTFTPRDDRLRRRQFLSYHYKIISTAIKRSFMIMSILIKQNRTNPFLCRV